MQSVLSQIESTSASMNSSSACAAANAAAALARRLARMLPPPPPPLSALAAEAAPVPCFDLTSARLSVVVLPDFNIRQRAASFFEIRRALTAPGATVIVNTGALWFLFATFTLLLLIFFSHSRVQLC